ncbi:MAG: ligase-associated DNA damage response endonuclease PdeM [Rhizomicrobium sp.]
MTEVRIRVNGESLLPDSSGALDWPDARTLVFADLHFEKGSAFARSGQLLPPYDTRATLARIQSAIARYAPARVVALGDSFHDRGAWQRLDDGERALLQRLVCEVEWIWIAGNHDPAPPELSGATITEELVLRGLVFRHEPAAVPAAGEIAGHLHPCKTIVRRGRSLRRRCFVSDGMRLVMPAFGAYAGGLDVREAAVRALFGSGFLAYILGTRRVFAVAG